MASIFTKMSMKPRKEILVAVADIYQPLRRLLYENYGSYWAQERSFYGEALLAVCALAEGSHKHAQLMLQEHKKRLKASLPYRQHHEFHWYAFSCLSLEQQRELESAGVWSRFPDPIREKPTNWLIMRLFIVQRKGGVLLRLAAAPVLWLLLLVNQQPSGLIMDRRIGRMLKGDRSEEYCSHQYHTYMTMLLCDFCEGLGGRLLRGRLVRAIKYVGTSIAPGGSMPIVARGRGAHQIFGYGALMYIYAKTERYADLLKVVKYMKNFQERDGSIPLVLLSNPAERVDYWESYNNHFDYLAFVLFVCMRVQLLLRTRQR